MISNKVERKNNRRIIKKLSKELELVPLNYFVKSYYFSLKEEQIENNRKAVIDKIKYNNKIIFKLKKEIFKFNFCETHKKIVNDYIKKLDNEIAFSKEVIKLLDLRVQENIYRKKQKNCNKIFKNHTKPSETI